MTDVVHGIVETLPPVAEARALRLQPGDVIVMTFPDPLKPHEREYWGGILNEAFPDHDSLLLDNGADLSVLRPRRKG